MSKKKTQLVVNPSWVYVYGNPGVSRVLDEALRVRNPQAYWQNKRRHPNAPRVDKYHRLFDKGQMRFPKGVLRKALKALRATDKHNDIEIVQSGEFIQPVDPYEFPQGFEPWEHQVEAVEKFWDAEFGIAAIPTRGGKSHIGLACATRFVCHHPVLYTVTKAESRRDIIRTWEEQYDIAPVFDDVSDAAGLHVVTYQLALNRDLGDFGFVVFDEAHLVGADKFNDVAMRCEKAWYRLGLTGTEEGRSDNKDIFVEGACGPTYIQVPRSVLVEKGLCADATVYMADVQGNIWDEVRNWHKLEKLGIIENDDRTRAMIECAVENWDDGQILVLVAKLDHGERFADLLGQRLDRDVPFIHGQTNKSERREIYEKFRDGELDILVASNIFNDSVTLPHVKVLIIAAGGKSAISTKQRLGRALTGDKDVVIVDAYDAFHEVLERHSKKRMKAYSGEGYEVKRWGREAT